MGSFLYPSLTVCSGVLGSRHIEHDIERAPSAPGCSMALAYSFYKERGANGGPQEYKIRMGNFTFVVGRMIESGYGLLNVIHFKQNSSLGGLCSNYVCIRLARQQRESLGGGTSLCPLYARVK